MATSRTTTDKKRSLEILGISEAEERAYRWLLTNPGATVPEVAQALALTPGKTQRLLDVIEAKSLTTHTPERPRRYIPASPDIALRALALRHQEELQRAEGTIQELQEQTAAAQRHGRQEQMVELITSREAGRQVFGQMHRATQHEVVCFIRSPILISRLDKPYEQDQYHQKEARARGVRFRSIADTEYLTLPGAVRRTWDDMKAGEEIRIIPHLPFKMVIADRRIAFIPLNLQRSEGPSLLVRSSALLDALYALFEVFWERAAPITFSNTGEMKIGDVDPLLSEKAETIIPLMAAGLNDKSIIQELEMSPRTLNRNIVAIRKALGARTRFQMGWLAALRLSGAALAPSSVPQTIEHSRHK